MAKEDFKGLMVCRSRKCGRGMSFHKIGITWRCRKLEVRKLWQSINLRLSVPDSYRKEGPNQALVWWEFCANSKDRAPPSRSQ